MRENEVALIGAVLRDGKVFQQAREIVKPEHFGWSDYGKVWEAMDRLSEGGMGIDTITVGDELERAGIDLELHTSGPRGRTALARLRESGEPKNVLSYAENVQDMAVKRGLDDFFAKCGYWSKNGRRAKDILADVDQELSKITIYSVQDEFTVPIKTAVSEAYDWTDAAAKGQIVGVQTGLADLDRILGGLYKDNVYILGGRPGDGKTGLLITVARHAAKSGKKVAFFSLEMSRAQVAQRLISQEAEVDLHNITRGKMAEGDWPKYTYGVEKIASLPIVINDLSSININQIRQTSRKVKASGGLDLIVVDYIQLADSGERRNERRELDVSAVSRGLKYLARELEVPVLAAAQLSRAAEQRGDKRPILSDLRESGSLEQDAYAVIFLYRPSDKQTTEAIVAKHRNGPVGSCELAFRPEYASFANAFTPYTERNGE